MAHDTLSTLLRLRRLAVDEAARVLGESLREEDQARDALARLADALAHECRVTRALASEDPVSTSFAAWRARTRQEMAEAAARLATASGMVTAAQDALGQARGGVRALETALARREAEDAMTTARAAQHTLDDMARRPTQRAEG